MLWEVGRPIWQFRSRMQKIPLVFFFCLTGVHDVMSDIDWCSLNCGKTDKNTMCIYQPQTHAGNCISIKSVMSNVMRKELLHLHNELREKIANGKKETNGEAWPTSSNMRQLGWDFDLEKLALRWNQQCSEKTAHDSCRRTPMFGYNGQNWADSPQSNSANASFNLWANEIKLAKPVAVDRFEVGNGEFAHFTQLVWAGTYKLGCSAIHADKGKWGKRLILICNYGPGGNVIGQKVYRRGEPCSHCPKRTSCRPDSDYPHLCALQEDDKSPVDIDNESDERGSPPGGSGDHPPESQPQEDPLPGGGTRPPGAWVWTDEGWRWIPGAWPPGKAPPGGWPPPGKPPPGIPQPEMVPPGQLVPIGHSTSEKLDTNKEGRESPNGSCKPKLLFMQIEDSKTPTMLLSAIFLFKIQNLGNWK